MKTFLLSVLLCTLLFTSYTRAQQQPNTLILNGIILDSENKSPVPFANVYTSSFKYGTISNTEGKFTLTIENPSDSICISSIGFQLRKLSARDILTNPIIEMQATNTELPEISVNAEDQNKYLYDLMKRAAQKLKDKNTEVQYGKAMYRQKSTIDKEYTEYYEMFYDLDYTADGISETQMTNGRYAISNDVFRDDFLYHFNYSSLIRLFSITGSNSTAFITPFGNGQLKYFTLKAVSTLTYEGREAMEMEFISKTKTPALEGTVFIDTHSFEIMKLTGKVNDASSLIKLNKSYGDKIRNASILFDISFIHSPDSHLALNTLTVDVFYNHIRNREFNHLVHSTILLFLYDNKVSDPDIFEHQSKEITAISDIERIRASNYDSKFWEENPIVLRTAMEDDIIRSFEKSGAFGNYGSITASSPTSQKEHKPLTTIDSILWYNQTFNETFTREKIYCHTNSQSYYAGDSIWFKLYILQATRLLPDPSSKVIYIDLINDEGNVVSHHLVKNEFGLASGAIGIPDNVQPGNYRLRCYTNWMLNFGEEDISETTLSIENPQIPVSWNVRFDTLTYVRGIRANFTMALKTKGEVAIGKQEVKCFIINGEKTLFDDEIKTNENGIATFSANIPKMNFDSTIFQFQVIVGEKVLAKKFCLGLENGVEVKFYPEGGKIVAGLPNRVIFTEQLKSKNTCNYSGIVVDENDKIITQVAPEVAGIGQFNIVPQTGKQYQLKLFDQNGNVHTFQLPTVKEQGAVIHAKYDTAKDSIHIQLELTDSLISQGSAFYLLNSVRGRVCHAVAVPITRNVNQLWLSAKKIPDGILQLSLFNNKKELIGESYSLIKRKNELKIATNTSVQHDSLRIEFAVNDANGVPENTDLSVSTNNQDTTSEAIPIDNYMLFYSELPLPLRSLFQHSGERSDALLELLASASNGLNTNWVKSISNSLISPKLEVEKNLQFCGKITSLSKHTPVDECTLSMYINQGFPYILEATPNQDSTFCFGIKDFCGSIKTTLTATNAKGKKVKMKYEVTGKTPIEISPNYEWLYPNTSRKGNEVVADSFYYIVNEKNEIDTFQNRTLDEINVVKNVAENVYDNFADRMINLEKMSEKEKNSINDLFQLIYRNYASARFDYTAESIQTLMMHANQITLGGMRRTFAEPLYYINERLFDPQNEREYLRSIDLSQIRSIKILEPENLAAAPFLYTGTVEELRILDNPLQEVDSVGAIVETEIITRTYVSSVIITTYTNEYLKLHAPGVNASTIVGFIEDKDRYKTNATGRDGYWKASVTTGNVEHNRNSLTIPAKSKNQNIAIQGITSGGLPFSKLMVVEPVTK